MVPGEGTNVSGSSALIRHSMLAAALDDVALRERQRLARGDADLLLDHVDAGHHLGDRVLDLDARVHLHEVEAAVLVEQELDRPGVGVADRARDARSPRRPSPCAAPASSADRGRFLEDLLVPPLDGALALAEVHDVPEVIGEDLDLDVARRGRGTSRRRCRRGRTPRSPRARRSRRRAGAPLRRSRCASRARRRRPRP